MYMYIVFDCTINVGILMEHFLLFYKLHCGSLRSQTLMINLRVCFYVIMHSYYTSGINFVANVKIMFTENRLTIISSKLVKNTLKNWQKKRMPITWGTIKYLEPLPQITVSHIIESIVE